MLVTNVFAADDLIEAAKINQNNADIASTLAGGLTAGNLAERAGLVSGQLADRYIVTPLVIHLVPQTSGDDLGSIAGFSVPDADAVLQRFRYRCNSPTWLAEVQVCVSSAQAESGSYPVVTIRKDGIVIGASGVQLQASGVVYATRNADPINAPLLSVSDDSLFEILLGESGAGDPTCAGVDVIFWFKTQLCG